MFFNLCNTIKIYLINFLVDCDRLFVCSIISCMRCVRENIQTKIDHVDYLPTKTQWTARIQSIW